MCVVAISREQESLSNGYLEESLPQKNFRGIWKYSNSTVAGSKISFFMIFIQNGIKRIRINLLVKQEVDAATVLTTFSWFPWKQIPSYVKKGKFADESWERRNSF